MFKAILIIGSKADLITLLEENPLAKLSLNTLSLITISYLWVIVCPKENSLAIALNVQASAPIIKSSFKILSNQPNWLPMAYMC